MQLYEEKDSLLQREAEQRRRADGSLAREAEQKRWADGILAMYESEKETFRRAADENRRRLTLLSGYRNREETLREEAGLYRKNHEQAVKDIARLTDELAEAVQEKVKAVSHGKELQDRLDLLTAENAELGDKIRLLQEQIRLGNRDRFGHTTEKTGGLFLRALCETHSTCQTEFDVLLFRVGSGVQRHPLFHRGNRKGKWGRYIHLPEVPAIGGSEAPGRDRPRVP